jgi:hypothetical protein
MQHGETAVARIGWRWIVAFSLLATSTVSAQAPTCSPEHGERVAGAWRAYRADSAAVALEQFTAALRGRPSS